MKRVRAVKLGLLLVAAIVGTTVTSACADDNSWSQAKKAEAISIALEDSDVRQQLGDTEYEIGEVVLNTLSLNTQSDLGDRELIASRSLYCLPGV